LNMSKAKCVSFYSNAKRLSQDG